MKKIIFGCLVTVLAWGAYAIMSEADLVDLLNTKYSRSSFPAAKRAGEALAKDYNLKTMEAFKLVAAFRNNSLDEFRDLSKELGLISNGAPPRPASPKTASPKTASPPVSPKPTSFFGSASASASAIDDDSASYLSAEAKENLGLDTLEGKRAADEIFSVSDKDVFELLKKEPSFADTGTLLKIRYACEALIKEGKATKSLLKAKRLKEVYKGANWEAIEKEYNRLCKAHFVPKGPASQPAAGGSHWKQSPKTEERKAAFEDTLAITKHIRDHGNRYTSPSGVVYSDVPRFRVDHELHMIESFAKAAPPAKLPFYQNTKFLVTSSDTLDEARKWVTAKHNVAVLDMANQDSVGGDPQDGAPAQEEQMCYRSNLYEALETIAGGRGFRPRGVSFIPEFGAWHINNVLVFKENEEKAYALMEHPFYVAVIASAAYKVPPHTRPNISFANIQNGDYEKWTKDKIRAQLACAILGNHNVIVLGAFGCGAFKNKPEDVARFYKEVLEEPAFKNAFQAVVFAIYEPGGALGRNYHIFKPLIESLNQ